MSNRFDSQPENRGSAPHNGAPGDGNGAPHAPGHDRPDRQLPPPNGGLPPMSPNVPQCPSPANAFSRPDHTAPHESQNVPPCPAVENEIEDDNLDPDLEHDVDDPDARPSTNPEIAAIPDYQPAEPPPPDVPPLSIKQRHAIHLLLQGLSDTAVAKRLGLNRKTIYRWKWYHARFYNTLDEAQRQAWNEAYGLLRSSILQSALKLNHLIKKGKPADAIKAARVLLSAPVLTRLEQ